MKTMQSDESTRRRHTPVAAGGKVLTFTEQMKGYVTCSPDRLAFALTLRLDITVPNASRFVTDPRHTGEASGILRCDALGGELPIEAGSMRLLWSERSPAFKLMQYHLPFESASSKPFTLSGLKRVRDEPGCDLWVDTSTLFISVVEGHVPVAEVDTAKLAACGSLYLQYRGAPVAGAENVLDRDADIRFGKLFLGSMWDFYGDA
jgi:cholesterol oxidase